jgi:hypothetical protein
MDLDPRISEKNAHKTIDFPVFYATYPALFCDIDCCLSAVMAISNVEAGNAREGTLDLGKGSRVRDPVYLVERIVMPAHFGLGSE